MFKHKHTLAVLTRIKEGGFLLTDDRRGLKLEVGISSQQSLAWTFLDVPLRDEHRP